LLKLSYWESEKERNARHWILEIAAFRAQLEQKIDSATLVNHTRDSLEKAYLGSAEKVFRWGLGVGGWGLGDGFYRFSGGQLPNFQGKST
jgi:hypothetical protein